MPEPWLFVVYIQGGPRNWHSFYYAVTLPNINRFSKLFHRQKQEKICNNTITKYPTDGTSANLGVTFVVSK